MRRPGFTGTATGLGVDAAVEPRVHENGLAHGMAFAVERAAVLGRQDSAHEVVEVAVPAHPGAAPFARIGRDEGRDPIAASAVGINDTPEVVLVGAGY